MYVQVEDVAENIDILTATRVFKTRYDHEKADWRTWAPEFKDEWIEEDWMWEDMDDDDEKVECLEFTDSEEVDDDDQSQDEDDDENDPTSERSDEIDPFHDDDIFNDISSFGFDTSPSPEPTTPQTYTPPKPGATVQSQVGREGRFI